MCLSKDEKHRAFVKINPCKCTHCGFSGDFEIFESPIDFLCLNRQYKNGKVSAKFEYGRTYPLTAVVAVCPSCKHILLFSDKILDD